MRRCRLAIAVMCVLLAARIGAESTAQWEDYRGWRAVHMSNGIVDLWVVPDIGGRVVQLTTQGHDYFFVNDELAGKIVPQVDEGGNKLAWPNYGGDKLWPAPQGPDDGEHWPGPGDPVLDGGVFAAEILAASGPEARVRLESPVDESVTGVQFIREIALRDNESRVHLTTTMRNGVGRLIRWSIWEVAQIDARSDGPKGYNDRLRAYVPAAAESRHPRGYYVMFGNWLNKAWQRPTPESLIRVDYNYQVGKLGCDSDAGWLAVIDERAGKAFVQAFEHYRGAQYPDDGSSVEFWINGGGVFFVNGERAEFERDPSVTLPYMEAEVLSPLVRLEPGEEYSFDMAWGVGRGDGVPAAASALALVSDARATWRHGAASIAAEVTPFVAGRLVCELVDEDGRPLAERTLALMAPGQCRKVRMTTRCPRPAYLRLSFSEAAAGTQTELGEIPIR